MHYDMRQKSLSYTNRRVREACFNGNPDRDRGIWRAYQDLVRDCQDHEADFVCESLIFDDIFEVAFFGACGVCCSELLEDEAPEPIMAAFLCEKAWRYHWEDSSIVSLPLEFLNWVRDSYGQQVRLYVEETMRLELADLASYNRILASGVHEEVLAIETSYLWCKIEQLVWDYYRVERMPGDEFERYEKLLLRTDDPVATELLQCYDRIAVFLNYLKPEWREPMLEQRASIAWACQLVYDNTLWPLSKKK